MTQQEALYYLQEIDVGLARAKKRLQEVSAVLGDYQAITAAEDRVNEAIRQLSPLQVNARSLELEIQSNTEKMRLTEERLYSGHVSNPKELQDMQQETQLLKKRSLELQDQLLEMLIAVETAEAIVAESKLHFQAVKSDWEGEHGQLLDEGVLLETQIADLHQKRKLALQSVSPEYQKLYHNLRAKKHNQPIATLIGNSCAVCGVEQTLAVAKSVRQGKELTYCMSCGRILVAR
jgi:predicted  nucleic acid-binding Zn-ribbon protein